jgi:hypothetical protein
MSKALRERLAARRAIVLQGVGNSGGDLNEVTPVTPPLPHKNAEKYNLIKEFTQVTPVTPKTMIVEGKNQDKEEHLLTLQEREAHIHGGGHIPLLWAEGYARLDMMPTPAAYKHRAHLWALLKDNVGHFLDQWGKEAAAAGWTVHDLFAVHRVAPMARYDQMGLLPLLETRTVTAVDEKGATLLSSDSRGGARQRWNRRPYDQQRACMVWELA